MNTTPRPVYSGPVATIGGNDPATGRYFTCTFPAHQLAEKLKKYPGARPLGTTDTPAPGIVPLGTALTLQQERAKQRSERLKSKQAAHTTKAPKPNKPARGVVNVTTQTWYRTVNEAATGSNCHLSAVSNVCNGQAKQTRGTVFRFATDAENREQTVLPQPSDN